MTVHRKYLARRALAAALETRKGYPLEYPLCPVDLAERMGIEVCFTDIASLEGMYASLPNPVILIGAHRPAGRRTFTCGHEIGHHVFGHGTRVDQLRPDGAEPTAIEPDEVLVQMFSGFLLMPKLAVCHAFALRKWKPDEVTAEQLYRIASVFGVTYGALLHHMQTVLGILPAQRAAGLQSVKMKEIRSRFIGDATRQLVIADTFWKGRAIDVEVGDLVALPRGASLDKPCIASVDQTADGEIYEARQPGCARLIHPASGWCSYIRVSVRDFIGRSVYRHLEEAADE